MWRGRGYKQSRDERGRAKARRKGLGEFAFPAGIAVTPDGARLYVAENLTHKVAVVDLATRQVITKIAVGEYPYDCEISGDGKRVYVSNWGSRSVAVIDTADNQVINNIPVGDHPNDLELTRDGKHFTSPTPTATRSRSSTRRR